MYRGVEKVGGIYTEVFSIRPEGEEEDNKTVVVIIPGIL